MKLFPVFHDPSYPSLHVMKSIQSMLQVILAKIRVYCLRRQMQNASQTPKHNTYTVFVQYSLIFIYPSVSNLYNPLNALFPS
jgi:hypothetical protein